MSGNPGLSSVGYLLMKEAGSSMFGGGGGGDSTPNKYGYKAHAVFTSLKNGSEFLRSETSDSALESLELSYTKGFIFPIGFETLTGLLELTMYGREEVNAIDVTPFTKLVKLNVTGGNLTALDISNNKELATLYIGNNMVKELDLSSHTKIRSLDITNNSLVKIDLSKNINIRTHAVNSENADIRLSSQTREMTTDMSKTFDFRELYPQLTPVERGNIVWDSIEGNGMKPVSVDVAKGTATFSYYPALITYDYKSGINYENTSTPYYQKLRGEN